MLVQWKGICMCWLCGEIRPYDFTDFSVAVRGREEGMDYTYYHVERDCVYEAVQDADWMSLEEFPPFDSPYFRRHEMNELPSDSDARRLSNFIKEKGWI
jgi:hypothetical protein